MKNSVFTPTNMIILAVALICGNSAVIAAAVDVPLNLAGIVNRGFVDQVSGDGKGGWSDQGPGNSLTQINPGIMDAAGVQFDILNPVLHEDRSVVVFDGAVPTEFRSFTVKVPKGSLTQVRALYVLHTLVYAGSQDKCFGSIRVDYPAGEPVVFDLLVGRESGDWWKPHDLSNGVVAYREINGESAVGLYLSRFKLPADRGFPEAVTFTTKGAPMTWIVTAATVSDVFRRPLPAKSGSWTVTADEQWRPYNQTDLLIRKGSALDFSGLVEPGPAGKHGFVMINGQGQLAFADTPHQPVRFLCAVATPTNFRADEVDAYVEQLWLRGYNACRPHYLDTVLIDGSSQDLVFNPAPLDVWDRMSAALKKRGIYLALDLVSSETMYHHEMPWKPEGEKLKLMTCVNFDPVVQEHWKAGVRLLLEHVNPYTGLALKDEPQVIYMALRNEPGLPFQAPRFWSELEKHNPTGQLVLDHFRGWLEKQYGSTEELIKAWTVVGEDGKTRCFLNQGQTIETVLPPSVNGTGPDTQDLMRFFLETEQHTFAWMSEYLKKEIGVKVPLNDYNNTVTAEAIFARNSVPLIDIHGYHDHPTNYKYPGSRESNESLVSTDADITCRLMSIRQWGKPSICTEWGQPFWNSWRREAGFVFPSYFALQGKQLVAQHAWNVSLRITEPITPFRVDYDPVLCCADQMSALLFGRGDVDTSQLTIAFRLDGTQTFNQGRSALGISGSLTRLGLVGGIGVELSNIPGDSGGSPIAAVNPDLTISPTRGDVLVRIGANIGGAERAVASGSSTSDKQLLDTAIKTLRQSGKLSPDNQTDLSQGIYQSNTGQLLLNRRKKLMTVNTPRSMGASLVQKDQPVCLFGLTLNSHDNPAAVFIGSLTEQPVIHSDRLVMFIMTDALNTDMTFTDCTRTELVKIGQLPVLLQTVKMTVSLRHDHPDQLTLWALAPTGERTEQLPLRIQGNCAVAEIDTGALFAGPTPYFEWVAE